MPRKARELSAKEVELILKITENDITLELLKEFLADTEDTDALYSAQDTFTLPKGKAFNKTQIRTNLGRYLTNVLILHPFGGKIEYINKPFDKKVVNTVINDAVTMMIENKVTVEEYVDFMERLGWLGYSTVAFTAPGFSTDGVRLPPKTAKLKDRMLKQYSKEISAGNTIIIDKVEKELLAAAKAELKAQGSSSLDFYESGARGSFNNNYKNMAVLRGLVADSQNPGKFLVGKSNLTDGIPPEEQHLNSNLLIQGAGGRAIDTRKSGYMSKQMTAAFQGIKLAPPGSDCKTKRTLKIKLTAENAKEYLLRYIVVNGKLFLLNSDNISKFFGKTVEMRSPMFCKTEDVCEKCYGRLPYELGIKNVGLTYNAVGETLKNLSMKSFHDSTVQLGSISLDNAIIEEK